MGDLRLRCVKVSDLKEVQDVLNQAFQVFRDQSFEPVWFTQDECLRVTEKERNTIYIFDYFEGEAFNHIMGLGCRGCFLTLLQMLELRNPFHLTFDTDISHTFGMDVCVCYPENKKFKSYINERIMGPMSILTSVALNKNIPRTSTPLYNMAMKDIVVCCTNLERETRESLLKLVEWMGGKTMKDFTEDVTHLVAGVVGSKKYQVAGEMGKQLMLPKWVDVVWEKSRFEAVHGMDDQFQEYKCPVFMGCVVTVSGLGSEERKEVKKLIEKEGGQYSGEMRVKETTHLIINEPKGQKYQFALKWCLKIVRSEWLYESLEKGYCQDEAKYSVKPKAGDSGNTDERKTSTPERKSMAGGLNDISNISAISMTHAEETRMANITMTRLEEPDPLDAMDMSKAPGEMFLDGCKVYLSGFRGSTLDKLRKIINIGGATRCNQITDNVTHMVIGDRINSDVEQIKLLSTRPHTVTANWLVECYKQERYVEEAGFYSSELPAPESSSPQLKKPLRKSQAPRKSAVAPKEPPQPPSAIESKEGATEDDMHEIMSQYMNNPDANQTSEVTLAPQNMMEVDNDLTQEPNETGAATQIEGGVFTGKTFVLFGFEEEHMPVLTNFIKENGGKVLQLNARGIPDYAVVPIDGFPVDKTVNNIITNVWLQMCIEQNQLLPVQSNSLFTPLEIQVDKTPLMDCVLSISGYVGVERDCLMHIAGILGASTQEYFVRNARKGLLPSTHLIVSAPEGSKYEAAVRWGIPAVKKSWLLACAKTGRKEEEEKYLCLKGDQNETRLVEPEETREEDNNMENQSKTKNDQSKHSLQNENQLDPVTMKESDKVPTLLSKEQTKETFEPENSSKSDKKGCDKDRTIESNTGTAININEFEEFSTMGDTEAMMLQVNTQDGVSQRTSQKDNKIGANTDSHGADREEMNAEMNVANNMRNRQSLGRRQAIERPSASQKENVSNSGRSTPVQSRVRELQQTEGTVGEKITPSKFLNPNKRFNPQFNVEELLAEIQTPEAERAKKSKRKDSLPLEELFDLKLEQARQTIAKSSELKQQQLQSQRSIDEIDGDVDMDMNSNILRGVVISVSKKLGKDQSELNDLVASLGGDYRWNYDSSCTHFIFQGRASDTSKEFRTARNQKNLKIVSPHWLYKCQELNEKVDESLYPHTYNPNLSLSVVSTKRTPLRTPVRSTRRGLRDRNNSNNSNKEVINVDATEETIQASDRLRLPDKADNSENTSSKGDIKVTDVGNNPSVRNRDVKDNEVKSPDRGGIEEEKRVPDPNCEIDTGSLEMREVLSKQLENVMAEPLRDKKRRKSKRLNNSGQVSTPEDIQNSSSRQIRKTQEDNLKNTSGRTSRGASGKEEKSGEVPQSQSVQVVWGDPIGRLEQEKLAEKLERANSPTQDVGSDHIDLEIPQDAQYSDTEPEPDIEVPPFSNQAAESRSTPKLTRQNSDRTPTPEGPSLAFPTSKPKKITPPRPVELIEEQPPPPQKDPPVFILSGMSQAEKDDYGALIEQLGGKLLESQMFDCRCTHLVINSVTRNEKFLASIASGKWVLHKSYFEACRQENRFVQEDFYEWGSEGTMSLVKNMESNVRLLAASARQWRQRIQEEKLKSPDKFGAFCSWDVILCCDKGKEASYKRLLEAGGATVVSQRPPFTSEVSATHVLIEPHKVPMTQDDFEVLLGSGCLCLRPDFISAHLSDPSSNVDDYYPPEIQALKAVMSDTPKKRKASESQMSTKRSRRR